jgi:hypothetical protein
LLLAAAALAALLFASACARGDVPRSAPPTLGATGLYADADGAHVAADAQPFAPQYPLWSDGAAKLRWISLPPGTSIDGGDPDDWQFPIGTRLWKQFTFAAGIETRFMQRRGDGSWIYATYVRGHDTPAPAAELAPSSGVRAFCGTRDGKWHDVPSVADCRACHENGRSPVLGFSALQLSTDRDPRAPHAEPVPAGALDLASLRTRGWLRDHPEPIGDAPRIAARTPNERAALGYLHGNCGSCHGGGGPLQRLGMRLDHPLGARNAAPPAIATTVGVGSVFRHAAASARIVAGDPAASLLWRRLAADDALTQMPPFGRHLVDHDARDLLARWIGSELPQLPAPTPLVRHSSSQNR